MAMIFKNQDISLPIEKVEKTNNSLQNSNDIKEEKIIINNCLATADKVKKEKLLQKIDKINDLLNTKKYNSIANLILKSTIQVVSDKEILSVKDLYILKPVYSLKSPLGDPGLGLLIMSSDSIKPWL